MINKRITYLILGCFMVIGMFLFLFYAIQHPTQSFIGGNVFAYPFYALYLIVTVTFFVLGIKGRKK